MTLKHMINIALAASIAVCAVAQADTTAAWACDSATYPVTVQGKAPGYTGTSFTINSYNGSNWQTCYIDSAINACNAGNTSPKVKPSGCSAEQLKSQMQTTVKNHREQRICNDNVRYLPAGVDIPTCVKDMETYSGDS